MESTQFQKYYIHTFKNLKTNDIAIGRRQSLEIYSQIQRHLRKYIIICRLSNVVQKRIILQQTIRFNKKRSKILQTFSNFAIYLVNLENSNFKY